MKKITILSISALLSFFTISSLRLNTSIVKAEGNVSTSTISALSLAGCWDQDNSSSSYVPSGVKVVVPGADTVGGSAWNRTVKIPYSNEHQDSFSLKNNESISIDFSMKFYDENGTLVTRSNNDLDFDIAIRNTSDDSTICFVRIWVDSAAYNNGSLAYEILDSGYGKIGSGYPTWIKGCATEDSSFHIEVSKEYIIRSYVAGEETGLVRLDDEQDSVYNKLKDKFAQADQIYFQIGGDNGFTKQTEVIVKSINGQSLSNSDNQFFDNVAPRFKMANVASNIVNNQEYTLPVEAFDLLGAVSYQISVDGNSPVDGKSFTPTEIKPTTVTLYAIDKANNVSSKVFNFEVLNDIEAPTFTSLPDISGGFVDLFKVISFDKPEYTDSTGIATLYLNIYKDDELISKLSLGDNGKFNYFIPASFESGDYVLVYEATNSGGTTLSNEIETTFAVLANKTCDFITPSSNNAIIDYVKDGIRFRTSQSYLTNYIGVFDIKYDIDTTFIVNQKGSNGLDNDTSYVNLIFENVDDPHYRVMYRVWTDFSGADRPTNVYISTDGKSYNDITDTGWISRNVNEVANQYHMSFNMLDTFVGERTGGMTRVDRAYEALNTFFSSAPSTMYKIGFETSKLNAPANCNYEMILTSFNHQSFANTNGQFSEVIDPIVVINGLNQKALINDTCSVSLYSKDAFGDASLAVSVTDPDNNKSDIELENRGFSFNFTKLGTYTFEIKATGRNNTPKTEEFEVLVKSKLSDIDVNPNGTYNSQYAVESQITILDAIVSEGVVRTDITITRPNGQKETVQANSSFSFDKPGIYQIDYVAYDDATPEPNSGTYHATINVPDTQDPVVTLTTNNPSKVGDKLTPTIEVEDDSEYDITVKITKPDNTTTTLKKSDNYAFTFESEGSYKLVVTVEDIYGNATNKTIDIEIASNKSSSKKGCKGEASSIVSLLVVAMLLIKRKK